MTTAWCRRRSRSAVATTESPKISPHSEAAVRGQDHSAFFIAGVDELEEQVAAAGSDREVADFVDDEQRKAAVVAEALAQSAVTFGPWRARRRYRRGSRVGGLHGREGRPQRLLCNPRKVAISKSQRRQKPTLTQRPGHFLTDDKIAASTPSDGLRCSDRHCCPSSPSRPYRGDHVVRNTIE